MGATLGSMRVMVACIRTGKRRRRNLSAATLIGAGVLAASCGSDDGGSGGPGAGSGNAGRPGTSAGGSDGDAGSGATNGGAGSGATNGDAGSGDAASGGAASGSGNIPIGGDGGNDAAGGNMGIGVCNGPLLGVHFSPANVLFVLDKSGSMETGFMSTTRWAALEQAVNEVVFGEGR